MQYILTEEEMNRFRTDQEALKTLLRVFPEKSTLQAMCTKIANEWPIFNEYSSNADSKEPYECVLTAEYEHYCDDCPVESICPNENKSWSK